VGVPQDPDLEPFNEKTHKGKAREIFQYYFYSATFPFLKLTLCFTLLFLIIFFLARIGENY